MKHFRFACRCLLLIVVLSLMIAVPALADYEMWVEFYYELPVAEAAPGKEIEDYFPFEGACTGLDFYVTGDGKSLMLYGAPLVPGDYYYDILYTYTDGTEGYVDFWVYVYPTEVSEPEPEPTAIPDVYITKHPTGETVSPGGSAVFIARADHVYEIIWHVVTPAGETYDAEHAYEDLPGVTVTGQGTETLTVTGIPVGMNGWSVECQFIALDGVSSVTTSRAEITVNEPVPTASPAPTAEPEPTQEPQSTQEPAPTGEARPTREPKPTEIPAAAIVSDSGEDKGGKSVATPDEEDLSGGVDFRLVAAIALGVIGVGLVVVLLIMLTKKKPAAGAGAASVATGPYRFRCDKCGWEPADQSSVPRFCPNCGDIFDEKDVTMAGRDGR